MEKKEKKKKKHVCIHNKTKTHPLALSSGR